VAARVFANGRDAVGLFAWSAGDLRERGEVLSRLVGEVGGALADPGLRVRAAVSGTCRGGTGNVV
jgi:hypothetical protein